MKDSVRVRIAAIVFFAIGFILIFVSSSIPPQAGALLLPYNVSPAFQFSFKVKLFLYEMDFLFLGMAFGMLGANSYLSRLEGRLSNLSIIFCRYCGMPNKSDATICTNCRKKL